MSGDNPDSDSLRRLRLLMSGVRVEAQQRGAALVVVLVDGDARWEVSDVARKASGGGRKYVPLGLAAAREREFRPLGHAARVRVYRFRPGDERDPQHIDLRRQFAESVPVGDIRS